MPRAMISWPSREQQLSGTLSSCFCAEIKRKLRLQIKTSVLDLLEMLIEYSYKNIMLA
jgi:hypothetical protein